MALDGATLGATIGTTLYNAIPADVINQMSAAQRTETLENLQNAWKKIAGDIVNHIKTNAQVTVASGIPVSTAGSATAQTGSTTGTGTGTIS